MRPIINFMRAKLEKCGLNYLVGEEDSFVGVDSGGLDPRVAGKVDRVWAEPLDDEALEEELAVVAVDDGDRARLAEGRSDSELGRVHRALRLHVLLLEPPLQLGPLARPWSPSPC